MSEPDAAELAVALALATKRLTGRFREHVVTVPGDVSLSQLSLLVRLRREGPLTAAAIAEGEHVSGQAIAQLLGPLKAAGLVTAEPHPSDGRKTLIAATPAAAQLWARSLASRDAWLARVLETSLTDRERAVLTEAVGLIERIAATEGAG